MMLLGMCTVCLDLHYHPSFSSQGFFEGGGGGGGEIREDKETLPFNCVHK